MKELKLFNHQMLHKSRVARLFFLSSFGALSASEGKSLIYLLMNRQSWPAGSLTSFADRLPFPWPFSSLQAYLVRQRPRFFALIESFILFDLYVAVGIEAGTE